MKDRFGFVWTKRRDGKWACSSKRGTLTIYQIDRMIGPLTPTSEAEAR